MNNNIIFSDKSNSIILTGDKVYAIDFSGNTNIISVYTKPSKAITIESDNSSLIINNSQTLKFRNQEPDYVKFSSLEFPGNDITFHEDGSIVIDGDITKAIEQLTIICWNIFESSSCAEGFKNLNIYDCIKIDLENYSVEYLKPNPPKEFFKFKKAIEKSVIRKLKLKAFW